MTNKINNICNTISSTVSRIDSELKGIDKKGIFFAPELHIAFECGKAITVNGPNIWGEKPYKWKRETKFENYGLVDLCFEGDTKVDKTIIIEFKVLQTLDAYINDIEKLKKLGSSNFEKYFCAILGFFKHQKNEHIDKLSDKYGQEIDLLFNSTPCETWPLNYKEPLYYSTAIWEIK